MAWTAKVTKYSIPLDDTSYLDFTVQYTDGTRTITKDHRIYADDFTSTNISTVKSVTDIEVGKLNKLEGLGATLQSKLNQQL